MIRHLNENNISPCGIVWSQKYNEHRARYGSPLRTDKPSEVTCKNCLRAMKASR